METKKKDKQRKKKNIIDRLMKLKNSLPYSTRKDILAKKGVRLIQLANGLFKADDIQNSQNYYSGYGATRERALHRLENPRRIFLLKKIFTSITLHKKFLMILM